MPWSNGAIGRTEGNRCRFTLTMSIDTACQEVEIVNKLGLHARAAAKLVSLASRFQSDVTVKRDDKEVNAKSIMGVMMLAAAKGAVIEICVQGNDAQQALGELTSLVKNRFGEAE